MSLLNKRWHLFTSDVPLCEELSNEFSISRTAAQVLVNRGITGKEAVSAFLKPRLSSLSDPFDIPGMEKAVARILLAKERHEKVLIYGDYDVDGVTATSILMLALKKLGIEVSYYIPHRYDEGYGMNTEAIKQIAQDGVKLIITVDCGISNKKEVKEAAALGMEVIITDHHNIPAELPDAVAVVDPKMMSEDHPSRYLAGAGVAFKTAWALLKKAGLTDTSEIKELLDLAALGTIADIVPLLGENRTIAVSGLRVLNEKRRVGVRHLVSAAGISGSVSPRNVSFMLAPRLNAPGRLKHASLSLKLLLEDDPKKAFSIAAEINKLNLERQQIGSLIGEDAFSKIGSLDDKKLIILTGKNWHPGVIGIVASNIADRYNRPTILISEEGDLCRGSVRSIDGFDVYSLLYSCRDLFIDFGGHKDAAGFGMKSSNIKALEERLKKETDGSLAVERLVPKTNIDAQLMAGDIDTEAASDLQILEPFGSGNPAPVLMTPDLKVVSIKKVGKSGNHIKIRLTDGKNDLDSIGFGMAGLSEQIEPSCRVDAAYVLSVNEWDGFQHPQLQLVDLRRVRA